jgi:hypothetical protein
MSLITLNSNMLHVFTQYTPKYSKFLPERIVYIEFVIRTVSGPGSSVGISNGYGMDGPGIESRWR